MDPELAQMMRRKPAPLVLEREVDLGSSVTAIATSSCGRCVAAATCDAAIHVYARQLQPACTCVGHEGGTNGIAFLPGPRLASVGEDGHLRLWDADSGQQLAAVLCEGQDADRGPDGHSVTCLAVNPGGTAMTAAAGKTLHILPTDITQLESGRRELPPVPGGVIADVRFVGETRLVLAYYGGVALVSTAPGAGTLHLEYGTSVLAAAATPDLTWLVGGCMDASVHIWHFTRASDTSAALSLQQQQQQQQSSQQLSAHEDGVADSGATLPPAASTPAAAPAVGGLAPADAPDEEGGVAASLEGDDGDDDRAAAAAASAALGAPVKMVQFACGGYDAKVSALAFDSNWLQLASAGGTSCTVWPFDGPHGPANTLPVVTLGHERPVTTVGWQPCAPGLLASGGKDGYLLVFDTAMYAEPDGPGCPKFCGPIALAAQVTGAPISALSWSAAAPARHLYSGDEEGRLCCWELPPQAGAPPPPPGGPPQPAAAAAAAASSCDDGDAQP